MCSQATEMLRHNFLSVVPAEVEIKYKLFLLCEAYVKYIPFVCV